MSGGGGRSLASPLAVSTVSRPRVPTGGGCWWWQFGAVSDRLSCQPEGDNIDHLLLRERACLRSSRGDPRRRFCLGRVFGCRCVLGRIVWTISTRRRVSSEQAVRCCADRLAWGGGVGVVERGFWCVRSRASSWRERVRAKGDELAAGQAQAQRGGFVLNRALAVLVGEDGVDGDDGAGRDGDAVAYERAGEAQPIAAADDESVVLRPFGVRRGMRRVSSRSSTTPASFQISRRARPSCRASCALRQSTSASSGWATLPPKTASA